MRRGPPRSPLFPYTPLFRSRRGVDTDRKDTRREERPPRRHDRLRRGPIGRAHLRNPLPIKNPISSFFFNETGPPEISPLPLHAALPISPRRGYGSKRYTARRTASAESRPASRR